jgi:hypothetical protein
VALLFRQIIEKFFEKSLRKIWILKIEYLSLQKLIKFHTNNIEKVMKKTVKTSLILCTVVNNVRETIEVVPFTSVKESAEFCDFVMECEKNVLGLFFGKETKVEFDTDEQVIRLRDTTDDVVVVEIKVDVHHGFEVTGEVVE